MDRATRRVSQNLVNCRTSCTINPQQIEVGLIELEGYSWPTSSKQPRIVDCRIGVVNKLVAKFFKSGVRGKVPEGSTLIFGGNRIFFIIQFTLESFHAEDQLDSCIRFE